jgi:hypothetical protein
MVDHSPGAKGSGLDSAAAQGSSCGQQAEITLKNKRLQRQASYFHYIGK